MKSKKKIQKKLDEFLYSATTQMLASAIDRSEKLMDDRFIQALQPKSDSHAKVISSTMALITNLASQRHSLEMALMDSLFTLVHTERRRHDSTTADECIPSDAPPSGGRRYCDTDSEEVVEIPVAEDRQSGAERQTPESETEGEDSYGVFAQQIMRDFGFID